MDDTRPSLVRAICNPNDHEAWKRFDGIYRPLLLSWCKGSGLQDADADEVTQTILEKVSREVRSFEYDPAKGRFRGWLFTIARNEIADFRQEQRRRQVHLDRIRDGLERREAEHFQPSVREHLMGEGRARPRGDASDAGAGAGQPEENEKAWIDAFQLHLFREAFQQLRESKELTDRAARVIELWWKDEKNGPSLARAELKLSYSREAAIRSEAVKRIAAKMLELGQDAPWLNMD
jgi:RNA polymerase sigma factor (sigma-70 family)